MDMHAFHCSGPGRLDTMDPLACSEQNLRFVSSRVPDRLLMHACMHGPKHAMQSAVIITQARMPGSSMHACMYMYIFRYMSTYI